MFNREELIEKTALALFDKAEGTIASSAKIHRRLSTFATGSLHRFHKAIEETTSYNFLFAVCNIVLDETTVNDWCMLSPVLEHAGINVAQGTNFIHALPHYEHLMPQGIGEYPEERVEQASAIIRVTRHLSDMGIKTRKMPEKGEFIIQYIYDEPLRTFLTTDDEPQLIADIVTERSIIDVDQIKGIMDEIKSNPTALAEGTL